MPKIKIYGIEGNKLTQDIRNYLSLLRLTTQFTDLSQDEEARHLFTQRSGGNLKLVWIEIGTQARLIESLAAMCQLINELELK